MPTGYTAGILDGSISTFKQFAMQCVRAFGAAIHMRDEPFDKKIEPRAPSKYHKNEITRVLDEIKSVQDMSDEKLRMKVSKNIQKDIAYHENRLDEMRVKRNKLNEMLKQACEYVPPTTEHEGIKKFMIEQLKSTIDFDCNEGYHWETMTRLRLQLKTNTLEQERSGMIDDLNKELEYHKKELQEEEKRCADSNKWIEDFKNSLG